MDKTEIWKYLPNESKESIDPWADMFFVFCLSVFQFLCFYVNEDSTPAGKKVTTN